jgi:hypothetical protein
MSFCLSVSLPFCLPQCLSVFLSLSVCLYVFNSTVDNSIFHLSISLSFCLSVFNSVLYNPILVSTSVCLSVFLSLCLSLIQQLTIAIDFICLLVIHLTVVRMCLLFVCLSLRLYEYLSVHLSVCLSLNILQSPSFIAPIKCFTADYLFRAATENSSKPHSTSIHSMLRTF